MAYDGKVLARARDRYETEKERRRADFRRQRAEIYARVPRLVQIDAQLRGTVSRTIAAALRSGQDPAARVAALKVYMSACILCGRTEPGAVQIAEHRRPEL